MESVNQAVHAYLTQATTSRFQGQTVQMVDHWQGDENLLWRMRSAGQDVIVKLYLDAGQARSRRQFRGHELFSPHGLAPRPLWTDRYPEGLARQVLIYEWMACETLDVRQPDQRKTLAQAVAQIHSRDVDELEIFSPHPVNLDTFWQIWRASRTPIQDWLEGSQTPRIARGFQEIWRQVERTIQAALPGMGKSRPTPIHGDLRLANTLHTDGRVAFVDWELCGLGDPAQEIARFLFLLGTDLDEEAKTDWTARYLQEMWALDGKGTPGLADRIALYRRIYPFHSLCFLLHGLQREQAAHPAQTRTLVENRPFLEETIQATLWHAARAFLMDEEGTVQDFDPGQVRAEVKQLLRP